jgi:cupin superfamily protein
LEEIVEHALISSIEKALDWSGPKSLGTGFVRGVLTEPGLCARILNPTKLLDIIMRRSLNAPQIRVFQDGAEIHPARFLDDNGTRRGQGIRTANMRRLAQLLEQGCTLVLDQVDHFDPTMEVACRALQWWSGETVQVNTYLTTQDAGGFPIHWDDHDVIVVQLAGEKSWEVRGQSRPAPMFRDAVPNDTPPEDVVWAGTMRAGEVMHIPRGYWHQATRSDQGGGYSLHATFGLPKRTGVHWLAWVADQARRSEAFRHDLNGDSTAEEHRHRMDQLAANAASLVQDYPVDDFLRSHQQELPAARHIATRGVFGPPSAIVCITALPPQIERDGDTIAVLAAGKRIVLAERALSPLRMLLSGAPADLNAVESATGVEIGQLVDVLLEEELCAELTPELRSGYTGLVTTGQHWKEPLSLVSTS